MKILILSHRLPYPPNKGEKIRTFNQIKYLADLGHEITVFSPQENAEDVLLNDEFNRLENITSRLFPLPQKALRLLAGLVKGESLSEANFYSAAMQQAAISLAVSGSIDSILCSSSAMAKYILNGNLDSAKSTPKLLMDFMDLDSDKWRQYSQNSSFPMSWVYKREQQKIAQLEKRSLEVFDRCYLIAQAEVDLMSSQLASANHREKLKVLGNGLNTEEFYPPAETKLRQNDGPVFIFTGVMDYKPNVDAVLWFVENCWQDILRQYEHAKFIVCGMNPTAEISELNQKQGIEVTGFVDEVLPYYHQADYFVAPFRLARGVQNKVLQAFACGLPVITTPMGAEGINCHHNSELLLANTPEEFIEAVSQLQADPELRKSLSKNALLLIQNEFSWQGKLQPLIEDLRSENEEVKA